ncbi:MAG: hypothetical protein M3Y18_00530 [Candidatus Eremiobacteraeota bacterium]|nr:hypothetical protein [Candidatus Eremiobacteraeota bacterium]
MVGSLPPGDTSIAERHNSHWALWLGRKLNECGANRSALAREYKDIVAADPTLRHDRRRSHSPRGAALPKKEVAKWLRGYVPGPAVAWRIGNALQACGADASGLEALLAAGHIGQVIATVGQALNMCCRSDVPEDGLLNDALLGVTRSALGFGPGDLPAPMTTTLAHCAAALNNAWSLWNKRQDPRLLSPRFAAAYMLLETPILQDLPRIVSVRARTGERAIDAALLLHYLRKRWTHDGHLPLARVLLEDPFADFIILRDGE